MSEAELRAMVRDVLREALGKSGKLGSAAPRAEAVRIASDADLAAFVRRLIGLLDDPAAGRALRAGTLSFTLAGAAVARPKLSSAAPGTTSSAAPGAALEGTVTEARIAKLAGAGTVVLAPGAVITPLARDRARALGLKIERRR
jgi:hypothetical protein